MPKPVLQALVLADHVYEDKSTGKKIIAGTFNRLMIKSNKPPAEPPPVGPRTVVGGMQAGSPYAFISLTEIHGPTQVDFRYVDLQNAHTLLSTAIQVNCDDPLATVELVLPLPPLPAPHPGAYALELLWQEEPLGALRITVEAMP